MHNEQLVVDATPDTAAPAGGEGTSIGGIGSQLVHVFAENRLAVVGLAIIVAMTLFCFLAPSSTRRTRAAPRRRS